jgi:hydantoinase/carbamoylase family amidase
MQFTHISEERIASDIERIASWNAAEPTIGFSRPTFSPSWGKARDYVIAEAERAGCDLRVDPAGNVHARPRGLAWDESAWICGSHLDSVPSGGKFDGVVGVVVALELLRTMPGAPIELVAFAEEEGTTFGIAMLGSRAWAGTIGAEQLAALKNRDGVDYGSAGAAYGVELGKIASGGFGFPLSGYKGMVEVHVEQGLRLWKSGQPLAVVTAINGRRQYSGKLTGVANHAGSTAMADRRDALAGAAEFALGFEKLGIALDAAYGSATITMGSLSVEPNAVNVVPGAASFTLDFRSRSNQALDEGDRGIRELLASISGRRGLAAEIDCYESLTAIGLDARLCGRLRDAGSRLGMILPDASSGALHDAAMLAPFLPTAMLFVASEKGISHNPAEFSAAEDVAAAARIVAAAIG